jgi:excisionase family DNA binding protein
MNHIKPMVQLLAIDMEDFDNRIRKAVKEEVSELLKKANKFESEDKFLTAKEAAAYLRISVDTLIKRRKEGLIKTHQVGNRILFKKLQLLPSSSCLNYHFNPKKNQNYGT